MANFPPLRAAVLTALVGLKDHLDSLDDASCPYDPETKAMLRDILAPKIVEKVVEKEVQVEAKRGQGRPSKDIHLSEEDQELVLAEIKTTMTDLRNMGTGDQQLDTATRIQIAKTKTGLLDTLLKMMERHTTVQKMESFKEQVIAILDDLVDEKGRETFLKRVEPLR